MDYNTCLEARWQVGRRRSDAGARSGRTLLIDPPLRPLAALCDCTRAGPRPPFAIDLHFTRSIVRDSPQRRAIVSKMLLATLTVMVLLGSACAAQSKLNSLITVSCAGYDRLVADVGAIGQWCGDAGLGQRLQLLLLTLPQGDATNGPLARTPRGPGRGASRRQAGAPFLRVSPSCRHGAVGGSDPGATGLHRQGGKWRLSDSLWQTSLLRRPSSPLGVHRRFATGVGKSRR